MILYDQEYDSFIVACSSLILFPSIQPCKRCWPKQVNFKRREGRDEEVKVDTILTLIGFSDYQIDFVKCIGGQG